MERNMKGVQNPREVEKGLFIILLTGFIFLKTLLRDVLLSVVRVPLDVNGFSSLRYFILAGSCIFSFSINQ
jgi:hypothetical protein